MVTTLSAAPLSGKLSHLQLSGMQLTLRQTGVFEIGLRERCRPNISHRRSKREEEENER